MTELRAPAKLTLSLRVLGTRADGFHELEALTVSLDAPHDSLTVEPGPAGIRLTVSGAAAANVPAADDNLVVRAARRVLPDGAGLDVALVKQIPTGAGLGGGSADAAAVLRACAAAYDLEPEVVEQAAGAVGSDVPFCLHGGPAWMRGRGEVLDPVDLAGTVRVLVVVPPFAISTPAVYRAWDDLGGPSSPRAIAAPAAVAPLVGELVNDLEPAAEHVEPALAPFRTSLEAAAGAPALLAGSGSACWVPFDDAGDWEAAARRIEAELSLPVHRATSITSLSGPDVV